MGDKRRRRLPSEADGPASGRVTLKIPRELYQNLGRMIEGTGFRSVNEFVVHVLRDLASSGKLHDALPRGELSPREIEAIRTRLRALGYIE